MNQFPSKNYFTLPNEIFSLGLSAGEIAVYAYLRCLENPSTGWARNISAAKMYQKTLRLRRNTCGRPRITAAPTPNICWAS